MNRIACWILGVAFLTAPVSRLTRPARAEAPPGDEGQSRSADARVAAPLDLPPEMRMIHSYLFVIDQYARVARDPTTTGVAAVLAANDLLKAKGPEEAVTFFNDMLKQAKNESVRRAIRFQLIELYKKTNRPDDALREMEQLIVSAPAGNGPMPGPGGMMPGPGGMMQGREESGHEGPGPAREGPGREGAPPRHAEEERPRE